MQKPITFILFIIFVLGSFAFLIGIPNNVSGSAVTYDIHPNYDLNVRDNYFADYNFAHDVDMGGGSVFQSQILQVARADSGWGVYNARVYTLFDFTSLATNPTFFKVELKIYCTQGSIDESDHNDMEIWEVPCQLTVGGNLLLGTRWDEHKMTWNNQTYGPGNSTKLMTVRPNFPNMWNTYDITTYVNDLWYQGQMTLMFKMKYESHPNNIFQLFFAVEDYPAESAYIVFTVNDPSGITLTLDDQGTVTNPWFDLSWTYPTTNGSYPLLGFKLYRSFDNETFYNFQSVDNVTRYYRDISVTANVGYYYCVAGYNENTTGQHSNIVFGNITASTTIISGSGTIGQMIPFISGLFLALFVAVIYQKRFSMSMFLIMMGMVFTVLVWLNAIPVYGIAIIVLLYSAVIWMAYSGSGATNE